jgi:hypothetical protein
MYERYEKMLYIKLNAVGYQPYFALAEGVSFSHFEAREQFGQASSEVSRCVASLIVYGYLTAEGPSYKRLIYTRTAKRKAKGTSERPPKRLGKPNKTPPGQVVIPWTPKQKEALTPVIKEATLMVGPKESEQVELTLASGLRMVGTKEQIAEQLMDSL